MAVIATTAALGYGYAGLAVILALGPLLGVLTAFMRGRGCCCWSGAV